MQIGLNINLKIKKKNSLVVLYFFLYNEHFEFYDL